MRRRHRRRRRHRARRSRGASCARARRAVVVSDVQEGALEDDRGRDRRDRAARATSPTSRSIVALVDETEAAFRPHRPVLLQRGRRVPGGADAPTTRWQLSIDVNVMAHVYAARIARAAHARTRRRLSAADRVGRRTADPARLRAVRGHQARGGRVRRVPVDHVRRPRPQGVGARAASRAHRDDGGVAGRRRRGGRRDDRTRRRRRGRGRRSRRRALPDPAASAGARVLPAQGDDYDRWLAGMRRLQSRYVIRRPSRARRGPRHRLGRRSCALSSPQVRSRPLGPVLHAADG